MLKSTFKNVLDVLYHGSLKAMKITVSSINDFQSLMISTYFVGRLCNSQEDFQKMANYLNDTDELSPSQMKSLLRNMGCKIPCDYDQYIHRIVLDDNHFQDSDTFLSASVFLKNQDIRIETEVILNDFWSFLAGVGGYMGLLLGFSMLTLYDFVAGMIEEFIAG